MQLWHIAKDVSKSCFKFISWTEMCNKILYTMCDLCRCLNERLPTLLHVPCYGLTGKASVINTLCKLFFSSHLCAGSMSKKWIQSPPPITECSRLQQLRHTFYISKYFLFLEICSTFDQYASSLRLLNLQQYYWGMRWSI